MPPSDFTHEYADIKGKPHTTMDVTYPDGEKKGSIALSISSNRSYEESREALTEYKNLAEVLGFISTHHEHNGTLVLETGNRSPGGLALLISSDLEDRNLVKVGEAHKGIEAVLKYEDHIGHVPAVEVHDPLKEATAGLVKHGVKHTTHHDAHHNPAAENAGMKIDFAALKQKTNDIV